MRLRKGVKSILAVILALTVILGSVPVFASGDLSDQSDVAASEDLFDAAEEPDMVILEEDDADTDEAVIQLDEEAEDVSAAGTEGEGPEAEDQLPISSIKLAYKETTYTGSALEPAVTVYYDKTKLTKDVDYLVSYSNNTNAGEAVVTVKGQGGYTGTKTAKFTIQPYKFGTSDQDKIGAIADKAYTGAAIKPDPGVKVYRDGAYVKLKRNTDYKLSYANNVERGEATVTIKFCGNYTGKTTKKFNIVRASISSVKLKYTEMTYTGKARTQSKKITVKNAAGQKLVYKTDYTVSYENNVNAGTAKLIVKGKGNYKGKIAKKFTIKPVEISSAFFIQYLNGSDQYIKAYCFGYNGDAKKPTTVVNATVNGKTVTLKKGTDYTVTYSNNRKIGTGKAVIVGKGNFTGKLTKKFTIKRIDYVQWAKYVADDNETYRDYGHQLPSKDSAGTFSCSSLVGAALYLNGYIKSLPPNGRGWLGGLVKKATCLEGQMMLNGFKYYSAAKLGASGNIAQNNLSVLKPGDIMWRFHGSTGMHVGIYMGDGLFIESRGGTNDPNAIGVFPDFGYFEGVFRLNGKYLKGSSF